MFINLFDEPGVKLYSTDLSSDFDVYSRITIEYCNRVINNLMKIARTERLIYDNYFFVPTYFSSGRYITMKQSFVKVVFVSQKATCNMKTIKIIVSLRDIKLK